jgi:hypothetical protein
MSPLIIFSSLLIAFATLINVTGILRGTAKPHRTTFFIFTLINAIAFASLFAQHDRVAIYLALFNGISSLTIFLFSIKYGMGGWAPLDITCMLIALAGIALWKFTSSPVLALYSSLFANVVCLIPTIKKIYFHPETEIWGFWLMAFVSCGTNLFAIKNWTFNAAIFPLYLTIANFLTLLLVIRPHQTSRLIQRSKYVK